MKKQPELKVYDIPTADLVPYANNSKNHPDYQIDQIAASIEEFGFNDPVAVWENSNGEREIVEGHGRVLAARKLGIDRLPVIFLNHLSDAARRAYTHVHNQTTLTSGLDYEVLDAEIEELPDFDWEGFGFDAGAIDEIYDLLGGDPMGAGRGNDLTEFAVTFVFDKKHEDAIKAYIKANGKDPIVRQIVETAESWQG